jgi:ribokinase
MTSPAFDLIVCGSLHLDIMVHAPHLPRLDETAVGTRWGMVCGGKGGNQAVMAARLGARTAMIGRIGRDDFGTRLLAYLDAASVDRSAVLSDADAGSGMSVALLQPDGNYGAVIVSGANLAMEPDASRQSWSSLGGARVLVLQNEIPEPVNIGIAAEARHHGAHVILNAAPARPLRESLLGEVDTLVVNRVEAEMMSGQAVDTVSLALAAIPALGGDRRNIIITLGGEGLVVQSRGGAAKFLPAHKVQVVSSHGAGDCFVGALALGLAQGADLGVAASDANRAAATYVSLDEKGRDSFGQNTLLPL